MASNPAAYRFGTHASTPPRPPVPWRAAQPVPTPLAGAPTLCFAGLARLVDPHHHSPSRQSVGGDYSGEISFDARCSPPVG